MNLTQLLLLSLYKKTHIFSKKFSISFCKKTKKELQQHDFFAFLCFFFSNVVAFLILDIAKSAVSLSVQGLFSIYVNGVKMHVQHS